MRQLEHQQKLHLLVPEELKPNIFFCNKLTRRDEISTRDILHWAICNTVEATKEGLPQWGAQGSYFVSTSRNPKARLVEENLELLTLYAVPILERSIANEVKITIEKNLSRITSLQLDIDEDMKRMADGITKHSSTFGADVRTKVSGLDEECERELEQERELEIEVEKEIPKQESDEQIPWDFQAVLNATTPTALPGAGVRPIEDHIWCCLPQSVPQLGAIAWSKCGIYATENYMKTVRGSDLSEYLRPVDALLLFKSEQCLLLSEWEADQILQLLWARGTEGTNNICFVNFSFLRLPTEHSLYVGLKPTLTRPLWPYFGNVDSRVNENMLAGLELLAGGTMLPKNTPMRKKALEGLLQSPQAKKGALQLVALRGCEIMIARSDLEEVTQADMETAT